MENSGAQIAAQEPRFTTERERVKQIISLSTQLFLLLGAFVGLQILNLNFITENIKVIQVLMIMITAFFVCALLNAALEPPMKLLTDLIGVSLILFLSAIISAMLIFVVSQLAAIIALTIWLIATVSLYWLVVKRIKQATGTSG